ncbi:hypothetical protein BU17DRAFT_38782 [Hysterangium stoloniferum]|nr:hypothetical protein BU17DRAFT_38782 [Hysterangium stoloniferum]
MPSPPIQIFLTTIITQPLLRKRQEYILQILQVKNIQYTSYDVASDETAKKLWRRKAPPGKQELPGILVGGRCPGTAVEFEDAVEYGELDIFLRLKESWDDEIDGTPLKPSIPVGVPGASSPSHMTGHKPSFAVSPSPLRSKTKGKGDDEFDIGEELVGFGLQGVKVSDNELLDLVAELGLGEDEANDLVKGLGSSTDDSKKHGRKSSSERDGLVTKSEVPAKEEEQANLDDVGVDNTGSETTKTSDS